MTHNRSHRTRSIAIAAAFALACIPCSGENPLIPAVRISPFLGTEIGQVKELVYALDRVYSQLDWDLKPLLTAGLSAELSWDSGFRAEGEFSIGIPGINGSMEDSDFLNIPINGSGAKTHFSRHQANVEYSYAWSARLSREIRLPLRGPLSRHNVSITPLIGFRYWTTRWLAAGGYLQHPNFVGLPTATDTAGNTIYKEWTEDASKTYVTGVGITYLGESWAPVIGFKANVPIGEAFSVEPGLELSVFVGWNGLDRHYNPVGTDYSQATTWTNYYDVLLGGFLIAPSIRISYVVSPWLIYYASAQWTYIDGLRGDTYKSVGTSPVTVYRESSGSGGGAAMSTLTVRVGCSVSLSPRKGNADLPDAQ